MVLTHRDKDTLMTTAHTGVDDVSQDHRRVVA
jgi:hypothetical protein